MPANGLHRFAVSRQRERIETVICNR
jgi:hypothetical protein